MLDFLRFDTSVIVVFVAIVIVALLFAYLGSRYKVAGANEALIRSGRATPLGGGEEGLKVVRGQGIVVLPLFHKIGRLKLTARQIIVNLAINGHDAMPAGGTLTIALDDVEGQPQEAIGGGTARPPSVRIRVSDSGAGMDHATLDHLFDPFFTTKGVGKGTGLGMSTVYGLVKQSRGTISAESSIGDGSSLTILRPKVGLPSAAAVDAGEGEVQAPPDDRGGVVLMVEDEPGVREVAQRVLER